MKLQRLSQKGFSGVEAILIVVIVSIIGGTGYFVYISSSKANKALDSSSKVSSASNQKKLVPHSTRNDTLSIKEWNVVIPLKQSRPGIYYKTQPADNTNTFFDIFSTEADAISGPNKKSCKGESIANIMRLPKNDSRWDDPQFVQESHGRVVIGDYGYDVAYHKQYVPPCFDGEKPGTASADTVTGKKFNAISQLFVEDFKSIHAE